ncbi:MAG: sigma-54-dependent Fis family transcriptional regulator [Gammaproteobacteria bacterium]|nr:sigma-54-dependent Fis family transcriptional regulator [Gammaproteobacteria bacterium]
MQTKKKNRILVVEDEADQRDIVEQIITDAGYSVVTAEDAESALKLQQLQPVDLVFSDWKLPGMDGLQLLEKLRELYPELAFVMATGHGSIDHAISAIRAGADDYLSKPYKRQTLLFTLEKVCQSKHLKSENKQLRKALTEQSNLVDMVGRAPSMQKMFRKIEKLAVTNATVLISGESGTGKELAARALHKLSKRSEKPFIAVNCAAIPETLADAEFFGAEKGAYTGADRLKIGKFEASDNGTIFLDEIGELPLLLQAKLLRLLQEGTLTRLGSNEEKKINIRVIAASNRNLEEEIKVGQFREDLYFRLNVVPLVMPPLRERTEDIPALVNHFANSAATNHGVTRPEFPKDVMHILLNNYWSGNVRELGNIVERLVLFAEDCIVSVKDVPVLTAAKTLTDGQFQLPLEGFSWEAHERDCLNQALELTENNRAQAARLLDLSYKAFLYRLEKHGL